MKRITRINPVPKLFLAPLVGMALACGIGRADDAGQSHFATPEDALAALTKAVQAKDADGLRNVFGPAYLEITDPDPVERENSLTKFASHLAEAARLTNKNENSAILIVGEEKWPFPIPLMKKNDKWFFDTPAGKEEILKRRIGKDEISAIDVCRAYVQAQRQYALIDRNSDGVIEYAQKLKSSPGLQDGLYWDSKPGEEESPFGPLVATAHAEGYDKKNTSEGVMQTSEPFHGYLFRILTKQGEKAPGGKYDYVINGHMVAGYALLAYPAEWGNSGVMTFIVNQLGKVFQKDLGKKTADLLWQINEYDPDETWQPAE